MNHANRVWLQEKAAGREIGFYATMEGITGVS
jgi:hypothetical protein